MTGHGDPVVAGERRRGTDRILGDRGLELEVQTRLLPPLLQHFAARKPAAMTVKIATTCNVQQHTVQAQTTTLPTFPTATTTTTTTTTTVATLSIVVDPHCRMTAAVVVVVVVAAAQLEGNEAIPSQTQILTLTASGSAK